MGESGDSLGRVWVSPTTVWIVVQGSYNDRGLVLAKSWMFLAKSWQGRTIWWSKSPTIGDSRGDSRRQSWIVVDSRGMIVASSYFSRRLPQTSNEIGSCRRLSWRPRSIIVARSLRSWKSLATTPDDPRSRHDNTFSRQKIGINREDLVVVYT